MSKTTVPHNDNDRNPALVSAVLGEGTDAHRLVHVGDATLTVWQEYGDDEPRMLDTDVAKRLRFKNPRDIRKLIERTWLAGQRPIQRATVARRNVRGGGVQIFTVMAYWLTEAQVLKVCARSEAPVAEAILDDMIAVYIAARRGLLAPAAPGLDEAALARAIAASLAPIVARIDVLTAQVENQARPSEATAGRAILPNEARWIRAMICTIAETTVGTRRGPRYRHERATVEQDLREVVGHSFTLAWEALDAGEYATAAAWLQRKQRRAKKGAALQAEEKQGSLRLVGGGKG